jgi:regulator of cell morphogenesis and NO signaling
MNKLVNSVPQKHLSLHYRDVVEILQLSFHLFAEDFIHHILDEEKKVFDYLVGLEYALYDKNSLHSLFFRLKKTSLQELSRAHKDDDEMRTIRDLTQNYSIVKEMPLVIRVLYGELMRFDADLQRHAFIENEFLFPQGHILERKVLETTQKIATLN